MDSSSLFDSELDYFQNVMSGIKSLKNPNNKVEYGTAGFRTDANLLDHVMYKMGLLAVLRSKLKKAAIGLMITASHNLEPDNGIKLVDPAGEMLEVSWETIATDLANAENSSLKERLQQICINEKIDLSVPATVIIGRDTRKTSPMLLKLARQGVEALNGTVINLELVTTPQLHYVVVCINTNGVYGEPTLQGYYSKLATMFKNIRGTEKNNKNYMNEIRLDAANGVGAIVAREFQKYLEGSLNIVTFNDGNEQLNYKCGADYVKVQQAMPLNLPYETNVKYVSVDGDADRVVYFYMDENEKFHLMDGDRIATLIAVYIKELLESSGLSLHLGLVQTAYSNGAATDYITQILRLPVKCVPTGVKHLHKEAKNFDIGVYFEANGHGTVLFKDSAKRAIREHVENATLSETQRASATKLRAVIDMINETVGDAFSDMLLVETILHARGWNVADWERTYNEFPNRQLKVKVLDRTDVTTTDAERRCLTPAGLQEKIDKTVSKYRKGRSFIRPSGTEDVVRVYAECEDSSQVNQLAVEVAGFVYDYASGRGERASLDKL
ncbi:phosphoacetylglucosamine mutase [Harpegnathos saltator]|uniref:Phosphoacetylglucosamine mutase n=1 Tax=Harpegnathos saltator TaxID=610380 RepID=E2C6Q6_HARSA|nr:phosphoacetylglucosamine mutase [Harpegnathos saltator]EFN76368.1 Phosphoacetylglucosamine mutase [Harpegnathos saltator]